MDLEDCKKRLHLIPAQGTYHVRIILTEILKWIEEQEDNKRNEAFNEQMRKLDDYYTGKET